MVLTAERLREFLNYDPETGIFTWRKLTGKKGYVGKVAGCMARTERRVNISVERKHYRAHRLAWLYMTGEWPAEVDHINGDPSDNRWCNLRLASRTQNMRNTKCRKDSKSGIKGISWHKQNQKWTAYLSVNGRRKYIGFFDDKYEAGRAYAAAAERYFGEFASVRPGRNVS